MTQFGIDIAFLCLLLEYRVDLFIVIAHVRVFTKV
jgi:hypothetical protein